ncbi:hypothetical protein K431DRAFT_304705 [Polychaeton citri CBS 116435]|uniref:Uncharacterized protein n=1 Tax=Polychaeton citri CBS 116435 TaxID=1314669 RepID=A0A9P4Q3R6_9PEZI|nr:hypothetical protein K431DRAFT_304705 [Polychaeton citri CBS 116435]
MFPTTPNASHPQLEQRFIEMYRHVLAFLARAKRFIACLSVYRALSSLHSTDSKLPGDLGAISIAREEI